MTKRALGVRTQSYSKCSLLYTVPQRIPPQRERDIGCFLLLCRGGDGHGGGGATGGISLKGET